MVSHGDKATPLWITEFAWGSGPPDSVGINKGLSGQATALTNSYKMLLANRTAWNLQHLFWFLWRDPAPGPTRADAASAAPPGLLKYDRTQKPAMNAFKAFTTDSTAPQATITAGPAQGSNTTDTTPTFSFKSSEAGSTFQCRFDAKPFVPCATPYTAQPLDQGHAHVQRQGDRRRGQRERGSVAVVQGRLTGGAGGGVRRPGPQAPRGEQRCFT